MARWQLSILQVLSMTALASVSSSISLGNNTSIAFHDDNDQAARRWNKYRIQDCMASLLPQERVYWCLRHRKSKQDDIGVLYDQSNKRAAFSNLMVCGSIWTCPVCASRITEQRRVELSDALRRWQAGGGGVFMVTFTMQHSTDDMLISLRRLLNDSYRKMTERKQYAVIRRQYGIVGSVASLEVTHSFRYGWHPHRHVLFFTEKELTDQDIFNLGMVFSALWRGVLVKRGRMVADQHGVVVKKGNDQAVNYLCKWSMAHEVTGGIKKSGHGMTPFQMAQAWQETGDRRYMDFVREYAHAFYRVNQLTFSPAIPDRPGRPGRPGLRQLLGIQDKSDDQIVAEQADQVLMASVDIVTWKKICDRGWRGVVLRAASSGDQDELAAVMSWIGVYAVQVAEDGHTIYRARSP